LPNELEWLDGRVVVDAVVVVVGDGAPVLK
jgi:hypothetical protein